MNAIAERSDERDEIFCERIICLHRSGEYAGWWHALEGDDDVLFAPAGRIVEASLDEASREAERAVGEGLRPLFFVSRLTDWPDVHQAIGLYQDFGGVYVWGRDDEAMQALLTEPSAEVLAVYAGDGRILVPSLAYGRALDGLLGTDLTDFVRDESRDQHDWWKPRFALVSRLNAFRVVELTFNCRSGWLALEQFYTTEADKPGELPLQEASDMPLTAFGEPLTFEDGVCELNGSQRSLMDQLARWFDLPVPQWGLLATLTSLAQGVQTHLSGAQQEILHQLTQQTQKLNALFTAVRQWAEESAFQPALAGTRGGEQGLMVGAVGLPLLITTAESIPEGSRLICRWEGGIPPAHLPAVLVRIDGERTDACSVRWGDDGRELDIAGVQVAGADIGWGFLDQDTLELRIQSQTNE